MLSPVIMNEDQGVGTSHWGSKARSTLKPEALPKGLTYVRRWAGVDRADQVPERRYRTRSFGTKDPSSGMRHKELERWYRLQNLQKAAQALVLVTIVVLIAGYAVSRIVRQAPEPFEVSPREQSGSRIEQFSFVVPGKNSWELRASVATVSDDLDRVTLTDPTVVYRGGKGGTIRLSADSGELSRKSRSVRAKGNVVIHYRGMTFTTGAITYSQENGEARTESPVTMEGGGARITGKGFRLSVPDEEMIIDHDVKARLFNVKWVDRGSRLPM
jgi:LPS export ABC transporter protein LptC